MEGKRFDRLARVLSVASPRRSLLGLAWAGAGGALLSALGLDTAAKKNKKKCKKCGPCKKCVKGKCKPKAAGTPCGAGQQCFADGACKACDVCLGDCDFTSVFEAVVAASAGARIQLCPGRYPTNLFIDKNLTVIGAGSGKGGTVLDGRRRWNVLTVTPNGVDADNVALDLRHLTVTGGLAELGAGIICFDAAVTLEDVHMTGNEATEGGGGIFADDCGVTLVESRVTRNSGVVSGGGIANSGGTLRLTVGSTVTDNTTSTSGGAGGIHNDGGTVEILGGSRVTGNTAPNCVGTTAC